MSPKLREQSLYDKVKVIDNLEIDGTNLFGVSFASVIYYSFI